ncbi:PQLC2 [Mytilus coruscus]|uniref:PQLC2 n=1 Tax=Mytilus coruscus TaxID=42192 RepID=A0A6J7ZVH0_MYTCO|nr:PQLC2 [Mytilus coruscus]
MEKAFDYQNVHLHSCHWKALLKMPHLYPWLLGGHHYDTIHNLTKGNCSDGVQWLYVLLGDCVTNSNEYASDIFGLLSIALWVFVSTPQMVSNCRNIQGVAGISVFLITQWTLGDTTNLIGSILTSQMPLQVCMMDPNVDCITQNNNQLQS